MSLTEGDRRKLNEESPSSWRSISVNSFCHKRSELYWRAMATGRQSDWSKYADLTAKFDKLHAPRDIVNRREKK